MLRCDIAEWNPVLLGENNEPLPMVYIKATPEFLDVLKKNGPVLRVVPQNTGMPYDGRETVGTVNSTLDYPNYRPNFYNKTGYYAVTLSCSWMGYELQRGKSSLLIIVPNPDTPIGPIPFIPPKPYEPEFYIPSGGIPSGGIPSGGIPSECGAGLGSRTSVYIVLGIAALFLACGALK